MHLVLLPWLFAASFLALGAARGVPASYVLHERRGEESSWVKHKRVASHIVLPVRVGLKQNQESLAQATNWLMDVSHPASEQYGKHWTQSEVVDAFKPAEESIVAVKDWLTTVIHKDRITHTDNKAWLAFDATVAELENLVRGEYYEHHHPDSGNVMLSASHYYIPKDLQQHIDYITPGVAGVQVASRELSKRAKREKRRWTPMPRISPEWRPASWMPRNKTQLSTCDKVITPACLQALYHFQPLSPHAHVDPSNSMGIFEEGSYYAQQDLDLFYTNFTSYIPNGTHPILKSIDGGTAPAATLKQAGDEADLDFEVAIPIIYPQTTTLYQNDDPYYSVRFGVSNTFLDAIDGSYCTYSAYGETGNDPKYDPTYPNPHDPNGYQGPLMCGVYKPTNVISISFGQQEQDLPAYYQQRQCNEYLKLGLQGVSVLVSSGDTGVGGRPGDGSANGCLRNGTVFSPTQPNSCPWLTNVGATKIYPGKTVNDLESAAVDPAGHPFSSAFSSGGGFSNIFPIPKYQAKAVERYFGAHNPSYPYYFDGKYQNCTGLYNRNGRGIPDVAANGDNIATYVRGRFGLTGGTSASCPIFASLITRINEERLKIGKSPVGFINPTLYEHPEVLNDIVNGTNPGCGTEGFSCAPGWDPVTGLGTPNYPRMLGLFLLLK